MYIEQAIESILNQTLSDLELLVIDDHSEDSTCAIINGISDSRILMLRNPGIGLCSALRAGVIAANAPLIARQDADDISLPTRLEKQREWLNKHPRSLLVGTWTNIVDRNGETVGHHQHPTRNGELQVLGLFDSYFVHPSTMFRRSAVVAAGNYPSEPSRCPPEDFDLWSRIMRLGPVGNIPEVLVLYRSHETNVSITQSLEIEANGVEIATENVSRLLPRIAPDRAKDFVKIVRGGVAPGLCYKRVLGYGVILVSLAGQQTRSHPLSAFHIWLTSLRLVLKIARQCIRGKWEAWLN